MEETTTTTIATISNPVEEEKKDEQPEGTSGEAQKPAMSRNAMKKQRKLERAIAMRADKRRMEREKRKLNRKNNKAVIMIDPNQKIEIQRKALKNNLMANSASKLRICIDCSFENMMNESDIRHLCKQLGYCYSANRRMMNNCLQLYFTSMSGLTREIMSKSGLENWDVHLHDKYYMDVFNSEPLENICYLTSDSQNELLEFDESKVYIIGGLVDHNHHKSICYNMALEKKIMHYRLPINKFMHMRTRPVLTVNHVYEIICRFVECKDWKQAFINTLPKRKGAEIKSKDEDEETKNSSDEAVDAKKLKTDNESTESGEQKAISTN